MSHFKVTDYGELLLLSAAHMIFRKKQQSKLQIDFSLKAFLTFQHFIIWLFWPVFKKKFEINSTDTA